MQVFQHPRGQIITLDPREQFALADEGGPVRVRTVTTFPRGDELGPYWTAAGEGVVDGQFRELGPRFRDAGLLPPHVRGAVRGVQELDFPPDTTLAATLSVVPAIQRGEVGRDVIAKLPAHTPEGVRRYPQRGR